MKGIRIRIVNEADVMEIQELASSLGVSDGEVVRALVRKGLDEAFGNEVPVAEESCALSGDGLPCAGGDSEEL